MRRSLIELAKHPRVEPSDWDDAIGTLLHYAMWHDAAEWLRRQEAKSPGALSLPLLRARLLDGQGHAPEAIARLRETLDRAEQAGTSQDRDREVAAILHEFRFAPETEQLFRELARRQPGLWSGLAMWLARQGQIDSALAVCQQAAEQGKLFAAAMNAVHILMMTDPTGDQLQRVEALIATAVRAQPNSLDLQLLVALLRHAQGQPEESVRLFRELLDRGSEPLSTLNNLAWVLCEGLGRPDEAVQYVEQAIASYGLIPQLRDTRGVILTRRGRYDEAADDLLESTNVRSYASTATYLNLARACYMAGRHDDARAALQRINDGPFAIVLPSLKQQEYSRLVEELAREEKESSAR
jgi:tetratricopeptide (TPR) repeat protein